MRALMTFIGHWYANDEQLHIAITLAIS